mmetsp:Transcript_67083/g.196186  ORF Transcript_67083/g.196186 Transcript_67083/m.196186 type:complete len:164 (+) Transcript_67083:414-905(+)
MLRRCATQARCLALAARIGPLAASVLGTPLALQGAEADSLQKLLAEEHVSARDRTESARSIKTELSRLSIDAEEGGEVSDFTLALGLRDGGAVVLCLPTELLPESPPFLAFSSEAGSASASSHGVCAACSDCELRPHGEVSCLNRWPSTELLCHWPCDDKLCR